MFLSITYPVTLSLLVVISLILVRVVASVLRLKGQQRTMVAKHGRNNTAIPLGLDMRVIHMIKWSSAT